MVVVPEMVVAEDMTGKFCRRLPPVSVSPASFGVGPLAPKSMPASLPKATPFAKIEFERMLLPTAESKTTTPSKALPRSLMPSLWVPMRLPRTVFLSASSM
jgi:hypothetical protein